MLFIIYNEILSRHKFRRYTGYFFEWLYTYTIKFFENIQQRRRPCRCLRTEKSTINFLCGNYGTAEQSLRAFVWNI